VEIEETKTEVVKEESKRKTTVISVFVALLIISLAANGIQLAK
jgi:hypothetical protein